VFFVMVAVPVSVTVVVMAPVLVVGAGAEQQGGGEKGEEGGGSLFHAKSIPLETRPERKALVLGFGSNALRAGARRA
jgi:hypothetical protein